MSWFKFNTDHTNDGVPQPPASAGSQCPLTFSEDMTDKQLAQWLTAHQKLAGTDYQQDINKLKGMSLH